MLIQKKQRQSVDANKQDTCNACCRTVLLYYIQRGVNFSLPRKTKINTLNLNLNYVLLPFVNNNLK